MQQYFIENELHVNDLSDLREDVIYHLTKVLRCTNEEFRVVDANHDIYLCRLENKKARVIEKLEENNELDVDITAIVSLIKSDKFELTLQKLTELGVKRIVPYNAKRSVVKENKPEKKLERYKKILMEASEQSHRNIIPEIEKAIDFKDLKNYMSDLNLIAYEKEDINSKSELKAKSITFIIGPEGGFTSDEVDSIKALGFKSISLGKRILRAETAALYLSSLIVGENS